MADEKHGPRLGADPEVFVMSTETGKVVPVCGKVGGTKEAPLSVDSLVESVYGKEYRRRLVGAVDDDEAYGCIGNYAVQEDNVMLEFNIPAFSDSNHFCSSISKILAVVDDNILAPKKLKVHSRVSHSFKENELKEYPQAFVAGCLPDMHAYADENRIRQPFTTAHFGNTRFCGGHIHVEYNFDNVPRHIFVQYMDIVAQLPWLKYDKQGDRRKFYGIAGIYRERPYGIEYRTPSNFWLNGSFKEKYLHLMADSIYHLARTANLEPETLQEHYGKIDWEDVQSAINNEDVKLADDMLQYFRTKLGIYIHVPG